MPRRSGSLIHPSATAGSRWTSTRPTRSSSSQIDEQAGRPHGIIRQTEFFIYSQKGPRGWSVAAIRLAPRRSHPVRATKEDFRLVRDLGIRERAYSARHSDYHIFKKMKLTRAQAMKKYLETVGEAFRGRRHAALPSEDITRADFYGFVAPFCHRTDEDVARRGHPRAHPRHGTSWATACLTRKWPRRAACPASLHGLQHYSDVSSEMPEWHGHNDFTRPSQQRRHRLALRRLVPSTARRWALASAPGNIPLEAMVSNMPSLRGPDGMDPTVITEIADYFK